MATREEVLTGVLDVDRKRWRRGMKAAERDVGGLKKATLASSKAMTTAFVAAGVAAGAMFAKSVKAASDFRRAMNQATTVAGATTEQMQKMQETALQLGRDTSFSASQAAGAFLELARSGFDAQQAIEGVDAVVTLAAAAQTSMSRAAEISSDVMTSFGLKATDLEDIVNSMAGATLNSAQNFEDLTFAMKYAGPSFAGARWSVEELAAATAALASHGIKGSTAGTGLRAIITRLIRPSNQAKDIMTKLGISVANADGSFKSFSQLVGEVNEKTAHLSDTQKALAFATMFGMTAQNAARALFSNTADDIDELIAKVNEQGQAAKAAEATMIGLGGALTYIAGTIESTMIVAMLPLEETIDNIIRGIADLIAVAGERLAEIFTAIMERFREWADTSNLVQTATETLGVAMDVIKFIALALMESIIFLVDTWRSLPEGVRNVIKTVLAAVVAFKAIALVIAAVANPVTIAIAVITALYVAWRDNLLGIRDIVANVVQGIIGAFKGWYQFQVDLFMTYIRFLKSISSSIQYLEHAWKSNLLGVRGIVANFVQNLRTGLLAWLDKAFKWISDRLKVLREVWQKFTGNIMTIVNAWRSGIITNIGDMFGLIAKALGSFAWSMIQGWRSWLIPTGEFLDKWIGKITEMWLGFVNAVIGMWNNLISGVSSMWNRFAGSKVGKMLNLITIGGQFQLQLQTAGAPSSIADSIRGMFEAGDKWQAKADWSLDLLAKAATEMQNASVELAETGYEIADVPTPDPTPEPSGAGANIPPDIEDEDEEEEEKEKKKKKKATTRRTGTGRAGRAATGTGKTITMNNTFNMTFQDADPQRVRAAVEQAVEMSFQKLNLAC